MYPIYFPAALKTAGGKLLELGEACLAQAQNAMDFNSEFVPLMNLGEMAEIVRLEDKKELERFPGSVYRCTKKSLRLTGIPSRAIEQANQLFQVNAHIPVSLFLSPDGSPDFQADKASRITGNIRYLSPELIRITALEWIPPGQVFAASASSPEVILNQLCLQVTSRVSLGHNAAVLLCRILPSSPENRRAIARFMREQGPQIRLL